MQNMDKITFEDKATEATKQEWYLLWYLLSDNPGQLNSRWFFNVVDNNHQIIEPTSVASASCHILVIFDASNPLKKHL